MNLHNVLVTAACGCAIVCASSSCVKIDATLGYDFVLENEKYITRTVYVPIGEMHTGKADSLSAYNAYRMVIGSTRDKDFGLTRRGAAFGLIPLADTLDWGSNVRFNSFRFTSCKDTLFAMSENDESIIQNIRVYALKKPIDSTYRYPNDLKKSDFDGQPTITIGTPTYNGGDSLTFFFNESFARSYIHDGEQEPISSVEEYEKEHPGIYICCDDPIGYGGRTNGFDVEISVDSYNYIMGVYAELQFTADYGTRTNVDTSFCFGFGPTDLTTDASYYSFNTIEHESDNMPGLTGLVGEKCLVEGGTGPKPWFEAAHLRSIFIDAIQDTLSKYNISDYGVRNGQLVINKATVKMQYEYSTENYGALDIYPEMLNPTMRISSVDTVTYAGLTDASVSDEDQGDIDYSNECYAPDLSHHFQTIIRTSDPDTLRRENIWFLILAEETIETSSSSSSSDYYTQLAYLNYYNQMLGGYSYGSSSYSNYYNYYMLQALYSSSSSSSTTTTMLDRDKFYKGVLYGPKASNPDKRPLLAVTYSINDNRIQ